MSDHVNPSFTMSIFQDPAYQELDSCISDSMRTEKQQTALFSLLPGNVTDIQAVNQMNASTNSPTGTDAEGEMYRGTPVPTPESRSSPIRQQEIDMQSPIRKLSQSIKTNKGITTTDDFIEGMEESDGSTSSQVETIIGGGFLSSTPEKRNKRTSPRKQLSQSVQEIITQSTSEWRENTRKRKEETTTDEEMETKKIKISTKRELNFSKDDEMSDSSIDSTRVKQARTRINKRKATAGDVFVNPLVLTLPEPRGKIKGKQSYATALLTALKTYGFVGNFELHAGVATIYRPDKPKSPVDKQITTNSATQTDPKRVFHKQLTSKLEDWVEDTQKLSIETSNKKPPATPSSPLEGKSSTTQYGNTSTIGPFPVFSGESSFGSVSTKPKISSVTPTQKTTTLKATPKHPSKKGHRTLESKKPLLGSSKSEPIDSIETKSSESKAPQSKIPHKRFGVKTILGTTKFYETTNICVDCDPKYRATRPTWVRHFVNYHKPEEADCLVIPN